MLKAATEGRVSLPGFRQELGYHEQRNALGSGGAAFQTRQHEVNDVLGHVVFTGGNEDLGAGDGVGAVAVVGGLGAAGADVGIGVRQRRLRHALAVDVAVVGVDAEAVERGGQEVEAALRVQLDAEQLADLADLLMAVSRAIRARTRAASSSLG